MTETPQFDDRTIAINLDTVEREKTFKPFVFVLNGRAINMIDPAELDWTELLEIDDPITFFKYALSEEDKAYFKEQAMPGWKMEKLAEAYQRHFGLGTKGNGIASRI